MDHRRHRADAQLLEVLLAGPHLGGELVAGQDGRSALHVQPCLASCAQQHLGIAGVFNRACGMRRAVRA